MRSVKEVISKVDVVFSDQVCKKHKKEIKKVVLEGKEVCPICYRMQMDLELQEEGQRKYIESKLYSKYATLNRHSLLSDASLKGAKISSFRSYCDETDQNKCKVIDLIGKISKGEAMSVWFSGNTGVGKSHLAMGMLDSLNEIGKNRVEEILYSEISLVEKLTYGISCLFINSNMLMDAIRESFNDKFSKTTPKYMIDLLTSVDFLVLDDVGSEVGGIVTDKRATDFVTKTLYAIANGRQDKTTIYTTNLSSQTLRNLYDEKTFSRMTRNAEAIVFKTAKDQRGGVLEF